MMHSPVVELRNVSKVYPAWNTPLDCLRSLFRRRQRTDGIAALRDVSLSVQPGDVIGLVGKNGAGKSTLLRLVAGISTPSEGAVSHCGDIYALLDLAAGMNPFLSGRENIHRRLGLQGLRKRDIARHVEAIAHFAELPGAIDEPMRTYSTGMSVRLAFAIATALQPRVFLIDEVLAVGDEFFAAKSFRRIQEMAQGGQATIVASHDWSKTFRLCNRIVWLDKGRIVEEGKPDEIMYKYITFLNAYTMTKQVRIKGVDVVQDGRPTTELRADAPVSLRIHYEASRSGEAISVIAGWMHATTGESVLSAWSVDDRFVATTEALRGTLEARYESLPMAPGEYDFVVFLADPAQGPFPLEYFDIWGPTTGQTTRVVIGGRRAAPLLNLPIRWSSGRDRSTAAAVLGRCA